MKIIILMTLFFATIIPLRSGNAQELSIIALGDSLTAGYGVDEKFSYPSILESLLKRQGLAAKVANAGVSGSTTASGLARLKWVGARAKAQYLILALGANDGLRGLKVEQSKNNLDQIIRYAKAQGMEVILAGMRMPPNYGKEYTEKFHQMYKELASEHQLIFHPFLLDEVGGKKEYNLEDGIHPNEKGYELIAKGLFKTLEKRLKDKNKERK